MKQNKQENIPSSFTSKKMEEFKKEFFWASYHINDDKYVCLQSNEQKYNLEMPKKLKDFIKSAIAQAQAEKIKEIREMIESYKREAIKYPMKNQVGKIEENYNRGFNQALQDILSKLRE